MVTRFQHAWLRLLKVTPSASTYGMTPGDLRPWLPIRWRSSIPNERSTNTAMSRSALIPRQLKEQVTARA
jgi:hypothetical protein